MPKPSKQSVKTVKNYNIDNKGMAPLPEVSEDQIEAQLRGFGLAGYEVALVVARVLDRKPLKQIAKEQGWVDFRSAAYHFKKALKKLRDAGFKIVCPAV